MFKGFILSIRRCSQNKGTQNSTLAIYIYMLGHCTELLCTRESFCNEILTDGRKCRVLFYYGIYTDVRVYVGINVRTDD